PERVGVGQAAAAPPRRGARRGGVPAVDDVADPADGEPERESRCRGVSAQANRHAPPHRSDEATQHPADRGTPDRDPAGPDEEDLQGIREVIGQLIDDMNEPRADDPTHHTPGGDRPPILLTDLPPQYTQREPHTEENADHEKD